MNQVRDLETENVHAFIVILGGDSKTLMVVQAAPVEKNVSETVCSLTFAQRVRAVELGQATRRIVGPPSSERAREWETVSSATAVIFRVNSGVNYTH